MSRGSSRIVLTISAAAAMVSAACAEAPSLPDHAALHGDQLVIHPAASAVSAGLLRSVYSVAARFNTPVQAGKAGYEDGVACVQHPTAGAMGIHWVNGSLLDGVFDPLQPEALVYLPDAQGKLRLVAVEYIVFPDPALPAEVPMFGDQPFDFNMSPLPEPNFTLHVWLFAENPAGVFSQWNPSLSCPD